MIFSHQNVHLQRFIKKTGDIIKKINNKINELVYEVGKTTYEHVAVDGTSIKANNSSYNVLKNKDLPTLIDIFENDYSTDEIKEKTEKLSKSSIKFLLNEKLSDEEKLNQLYFAQEELKVTQQTSMGLNDHDARWMLNKKKKLELSYNLQLAVDFETKMILNYFISQSPTDHYQLENNINGIKNNTGHKPKRISADAGYNTEESANIAYKEDIELIVPTGKQTRKLEGKLNENPYHKDHFQFDYENKEFICPLNVRLPLKQSKRLEPTKKGHPGKILHQYYSSECNKCEHKSECTKSPTRVISDYGSDVKKELEKKMEDPEIQEEYKKRSQTVEAPFGVLKQQKNLNTVRVSGQSNVETRTGYKIAGYNLRRLENIMRNDDENRDKIMDLVKKITKEYPHIKISIIFC